MSTSEVAAYYDGFRDRLLEDYTGGSPRMDAALVFAWHALSRAKTILDVGCGIGWSSAVMADMGAEVTGVDISPVLVETARQTFGLEFVQADFAEWEIPHTFDAVLMVDSYEHFPRSSRKRVHEQIKRTRAKRLALTVPTPEAQQYARDRHIPLQIIDEEVTDEDIDRLARDIGGTAEVNRLVTIYRPDDYRHVLICR